MIVCVPNFYPNNSIIFCFWICVKGKWKFKIKAIRWNQNGTYLILNFLKMPKYVPNANLTTCLDQSFDNNKAIEQKKLFEQRQKKMNSENYRLIIFQRTKIFFLSGERKFISINFWKTQKSIMHINLKSKDRPQIVFLFQKFKIIFCIKENI